MAELTAHSPVSHCPESAIQPVQSPTGDDAVAHDALELRHRAGAQRAGLASATSVHSWFELCEHLAASLSGSKADPFVLDTIIVPSPGHRRALSQHLASRSPAGICAGIEFTSIGQLRAQLLDEYLAIDVHTDPWRPRELTLAILQALDQNSAAAWFAPLAHYLSSCTRAAPAAGRRAVTARRMSGLFRDYLSYAPELIESWNVGEDIGPDGEPLTDAQQWQPNLWRAVRRSISAADPLTRHQQLCEAIVTDTPATAKRMFAALVNSPDLLDRELLTALTTARGLQSWQLVLPPSSSPAADFAAKDPAALRRGSRLLSRYATLRATDQRSSEDPGIDVASTAGCEASSHLARRSVTSLQLLQADLRQDRAPSGQYPADGSIQVHLSHGPERQVEVLRDLVTGLFADSSNLEPRHVLILAPQLARFSAHLSACFEAVESIQHPGQLLRAQLAGTSMTVDNPILDFIRRLLALPNSRAFANDLIELISSPIVAKQFGLRPDDGDELAALLRDANASWGIDAKHRQSFGLDQTDGTWWQSIERMLLGLTLDADSMATLGGTAPLPSVRSDDIARLGALSEFVSRIRSHLLEFKQPASMVSWSQRLRAAVLDLVCVDFDDQWQLNQALSLLADWRASATTQSIDPADHDSIDDADLTAAEILALFDDWAPKVTGRPNFGNGTMLIGELGELQAVEHRVIVLLGMDDDVFPARQFRGGDDLLAGRAGDRQRLASRQQFLDAILAAQERLIIIAQGADERTNARLPNPIVVQDLAAALGYDDCDSQPTQSQSATTEASSLIHCHALQAHSWGNFVESPAGPFSFDELALRGARQLTSSSQVDADRSKPWSWDYPAQPWDAELTSTQLLNFLRNPARFLLKDLHGLQMRGPIELERQSLPLEQDALDQYAITSDMLNDLLCGASPQQVVELELGRGRVLRNRTSWEWLLSKSQDANAIYQRLKQAQQGVERDVDCVVDLPLPEATVRLTSRVRTWDGRAVHYTAGRANEGRQLQLWVDLLMLSASEQIASPDAQGILIAREDISLKPPPATLARKLLAEMVQLRQSGKTRLVPLPLRTAKVTAQAPSQWQQKNIRETWQGSQTSMLPAEAADPYWRHFFPVAEDLFMIAPLASDPVCTGLGQGPNRFEQLAKWLFAPLFAHESQSP